MQIDAKHAIAHNKVIVIDADCDRRLVSHRPSTLYRNQLGDKQRRAAIQVAHVRATLETDDLLLFRVLLPLHGPSVFRARLRPLVLQFERAETGFLVTRASAV